MKPMHVFSIVTLILGSNGTRAWAGVSSTLPTSVNLFASPESSWAGHTGLERPFATFSNFSENDVGKYLTIATGPEYTNIVSNRSTSFNGQIFNGNCKIINSPLPLSIMDFSSQQEDYKRQTHHLKTCLQIRVHDYAPIRPAYEQPLCDVKVVNDNEVIASAGLCFFELSDNSNFQITYEINPDCADSNKFNTLNLQPADIFAKSAFYISGDSTGRSPYLLPLGSTALRLSLEAPSTSVLLSTDMGRGTPRWPTRIYTDVHMGDFALNINEHGASLITQIFAANECKDENSLECQFAMPLGMKFSLRELFADGSETLLDEWYSGGIAPARWKGLLPAQRSLAYRDFKIGHRYRIQADLTYLTHYHRLFKDGFKNHLIQLGMLNIDPTQPLTPILPIAILPTLSALKAPPPLPQVPALIPGGENDLSLELNRMRAMLTGVDWPPFFEQVCGDSACAKALDGRAKLDVGVDFTIKNISSGFAQPSQIQVWRKSSFLKNYNLMTEELMRAECQ